LLRRLGKKAEYANYEGEVHSPLFRSLDHQHEYTNRRITGSINIQGTRKMEAVVRSGFPFPLTRSARFLAESLEHQSHDS
jgi:hypothetical protein